MNVIIRKNKVNLSLIHSGSLIGLALALGIGLSLRPDFLIIGLFIIGCFLVIMKYPEVGLSLFVFTGVWKTAPIFSDPNAYYPTAVLLIATLFFLLLREFVKRKRNFIKFDITLITLILFNLFLLISAYLFSPNQESGVIKAARFLIFTLPIFFMVMLSRNDLKRIRRLLYGIVWIGMALAAMMIFKTFVFSGPVVGQSTLFGENIIIFSRAMGITLVLLITLLIYDEDITKIQRIVFALFIPALIIALFLSGSRGSFFGFLLTMGLILIIGTTEKSKFLNKVTYFVLVGGAIIIIFNLAIYQSLAGRYLFQSPGSELSKIYRIAAYERAINIFLSNPILGVGTGGYYSGSWGFDTMGVYPHNIFLEIASETGLIGIALFLIPLVLTIVHFYKMLSSKVETLFKKKIAIIAFAGFAYTFITAQFSGDIQINRLIWLFIAIIWVLYYSRPDETITTKNI